MRRAPTVAAAAAGTVLAIAAGTSAALLTGHGADPAEPDARLAHTARADRTHTRPPAPAPASSAASTPARAPSPGSGSPSSAASVSPPAASTAATASRAPAAAATPDRQPTAAQWAALRWCESRGDYTVVSASGKYHGAYQFDERTWRALWDRQHRPDLAALAPERASRPVQDQAALILYSQRGAQPWPVCGRFLH